MKVPHPASLILLGLAALIAASSRVGMALFLAALGLTLMSLVAAKSHLFLLLQRSRWLLLIMLAMFGWLTPGTPLASIPGASQEGLLLAAENIARLLIALSIVALILKSLPAAKLVAGIRSLLAPLALLRISRDRIAVRLALTLNEVEVSRSGKGSDTERVATTLTLPASALSARDFVAGALAGALVIAAWLT